MTYDELRQAAQLHLAQQLAGRTQAIRHRIHDNETPLASSAGDLVVKRPGPPTDATPREIKAHYPVADGDFVLTDRTLYYRDPRGLVYELPLGLIMRWKQRRTQNHPYLPARLRRRILAIDVHLSDGRQYVVEVGKVFAKQVRKTGGIRRAWRRA